MVFCFLMLLLSTPSLLRVLALVCGLSWELTSTGTGSLLQGGFHQPLHASFPARPRPVPLLLCVLLPQGIRVASVGLLIGNREYLTKGG